MISTAACSSVDNRFLWSPPDSRLQTVDDFLLSSSTSLSAWGWFPIGQASSHLLILCHTMPSVTHSSNSDFVTDFLGVPGAVFHLSAFAVGAIRRVVQNNGWFNQILGVRWPDCQFLKIFTSTTVLFSQEARGSHKLHLLLCEIYVP